MMSAWRSLLGRSHHLLLSRLRPVHRRTRQFSPILGRRNLIGSRGYASSANGDSHAEVNRQHPAALETSKRHLYVVLDDHKDSYGIHKLDMDDDKDDDLDGGQAISPRRLPLLPVLSVALTTFRKGTKFAAVGSSIVAIGCQPEPEGCGEDEGRVLIYDTEQAETMVVSHQLPEGLVYGYNIATAVGQRLYILESYSCLSSHNRDPGQREWTHCGGLHCLASDPDVGEGNEFWQWRPLSPSSRWSWSEDDRLLGIPFYAADITACAVHVPPGSVAMHPDIYVSVQYHPFGDTGDTFSFSTASGEWTERGEWLLPVIGHAHYDSQLDAWLGLHARASYDCPRFLDGHLCAGDIASGPREWEVGEDKLFCREEDTAAGWRHVDAKLVPTEPGVGGNEYCLMERLRQEGDDQECLGDGDKWLLRLTVFRVERGHHGQPVVTARHPARCYRMSRYNKYFDAQAFWI